MDFGNFLLSFGCQRLAKSLLKTMDFTDNVFYKNKTSKKKIIITSTATITVDYCTFVECNNNEGGAIFIEADKFDCFNSKFVFCKSDVAGAIWAKGKDMTLDSCCFLGCESIYRYHTFIIFGKSTSTFNCSTISKINNMNAEYTAGFNQGSRQLNYCNCSTVISPKSGGFISATVFPEDNNRITFGYCCLSNTTTGSIFNLIKISDSGNTALFDLKFCLLLNNTFSSIILTNANRCRVNFMQCVLLNNALNESIINVSKIRNVSVFSNGTYITADTLLGNNIKFRATMQPETPTQIFNSTIFAGDCANVATRKATPTPKPPPFHALLITSCVLIFLIIIVTVIVYCVHNKKDQEEYDKWVHKSSSQSDFSDVE